MNNCITFYIPIIELKALFFVYLIRQISELQLTNMFIIWLKSLMKKNDLISEVSETVFLFAAVSVSVFVNCPSTSVSLSIAGSYGRS